MTPARILIAEDEPITAEDISDILTHLGYTVTAVVSTGTDAILQAERTGPELAMMDINLKGEMDGVTAALILRERFDIPVVFLTAHADPDTLSRAKLSEPLGYLIKPFQEAELRASIEVALYKRKVDREAKEREQRLAATVQAMEEGVIAVDRSGCVTLVNAAAAAWTGWTQAEAAGRSAREVLQIVNASTRRPADRPIEEALGEGHVTALQDNSVLVAREGTERPIGGSAAPVRNHEGSISGAVIVFGNAQDDRNSVSAGGTGERSERSPMVPAVDIVAESAVMKQVLRFAGRVARSEASAILLEGESGTGKDVIAKFLHYHGERRDQPFLAINCAAIPETLLESELFGYEKGAFTDARAQKKGILELATGGTVFLDEIGDMPLAVQAKLLRVLEDQCFRRLGGVKDIQVDLRVITATNRDLSEGIQQGTFRLDLYYRLNMIQIFIPPLRQRTDDILPLARHFMRMYQRKLNRHIEGISPEAADALLSHTWPGNVRELRNTVERAMILEDTAWVQISSLGIRPQACAAGAAPQHPVEVAPIHPGMSLGEAEKSMLFDALNKTNWNQSRAARLLKITRDTLRYKMKKFNLQRD